MAGPILPVGSPVGRSCSRSPLVCRSWRLHFLPLEPTAEGLEKGKLLFELRGHKLTGKWSLSDPLFGVLESEPDLLSAWERLTTWFD